VAKGQDTTYLVLGYGVGEEKRAIHVQTASGSIFPHRAPALLRLVALLVAPASMLAMPSLGWADASSLSPSLNRQPINRTIPEAKPEAALSVTLTGLTLTGQAQGMVLIYDDSTHTLLSDVVTFSNVGGVATVAFVADADGIPVTAQGLPVLGQFSESDKAILIYVALGNGQFLRAKICGDVGESPSCSGESGSIGLSIGKTSIPEPGTFVLLGSGLVGSGAWRLAARSAGRRLLKRVNS
jgi:PEP-CTERM motif